MLFHPNEKKIQHEIVFYISILIQYDEDIVHLGLINIFGDSKDLYKESKEIFEREKSLVDQGQSENHADIEDLQTKIRVIQLNLGFFWLVESFQDRR